MVRPLTLNEIVDVRAYERERDAFRAKVIKEKSLRRIGIGPFCSVVFENRTTIRFQVQEMARAENMVTDKAIQGELDTYNPLLPSRGELSLTLFLELTSEEALREWLPRLVGIEKSIILRTCAAKGEIVQRAEVEATHASQLSREDTTASVHYVRIKLDEEAQKAFAKEKVCIGADHPAYRHETELPEATKAALMADWDDA